MKFEKALERLEEVVEELEKGELSLDESLAKYENGIKMYRICLGLLEGAEKRLKVFAKDENGRLLVKNPSKKLQPETDGK
ncbi:MAG: exodeoxyribonuclease VII small subunit [Candidatus Brocadiales bacterium]|jgi:exodeoxyribonuclease VII small subunit